VLGAQPQRLQQLPRTPLPHRGHLTRATPRRRRQPRRRLQPLRGLPVQPEPPHHRTRVQPGPLSPDPAPTDEGAVTPQGILLITETRPHHRPQKTRTHPDAHPGAASDRLAGHLRHTRLLGGAPALRPAPPHGPRPHRDSPRTHPHPPQLRPPRRTPHPAGHLPAPCRPSPPRARPPPAPPP